MRKIFCILTVVLCALLTGAAEKPLKFYYFNSTHWDREWYQSFQEYRKYLVDTVQLLIDDFNRDAFEKFTFDGQSIVLEDVCELRPSLRPKLREMVSSGKLNVGPWYVMPDEMLSGAEGMIRNLALGRKVACDFGGNPWNVGYCCDVFGHAAQTPQIFAGFGLTGAVVWRGFPNHLGSRVWWQSPDGTQVKTLILYPPRGYSDFCCDVRGKWNLPLDEVIFKDQLKQFVDSRQWHFGDTYFLSDTADHTEPCGEVKKMFQWIREVYPDSTLSHSDLTDFFAREYDGKLPLVKGEQVIPQERPDNSTATLVSGTHSSRVDVKLANDLAQNHLTLGTEPMLALRGVLDGKSEAETLCYLWKLVVQNHFHDQICGCSIDAVHADALNRFQHMEQLAGILDTDWRVFDLQRLTGHNIREMIFCFPGPHSGDYAAFHTDPDGKYLVRIFNPLPFAVDETQLLVLDFDEGAPAPANFKLLDETGREVPYVISSTEHGVRKIFYRAHKPTYTRKTLIAKVNLRANGWTTLRIDPVKGETVRYAESMRCGKLTAENEFLRLEIHTDGTFAVTDKRSGIRRDGFNDFRITRDVGDGWRYQRAAGTPEILTSTRAVVKLVTDAPARTEFEIDRYYLVPKKINEVATTDRRYCNAVESDEKVELCVKTLVALDQKSDALSLHTELENNVCDYRLQLMIPTGIAGNYFASQCGAILDRTPGTNPKYANFAEKEIPEKDFDGILGKRDAKGGVALLTCGGIHEGGTVLEDETLLAVTLLRAFYRTFPTNGEIGAQVLKHLEWDYRLKFFAPETTYAALFNEMQILRAPYLHYVLPQHVVKLPLTENSFCTASGELAFSAMKPAFDGKGKVVVLRFFNPSDKTATEKLVFDRKFVKATLCRLDETGEKELARGGDQLELSAGAGKFVTVRILFEGEK